MLTNQAFLSNNIISSLEKNIERDLNTKKIVCKKLKLSVDQFPKSNLSKSQNNSELEMQFNFTASDNNAEKNSKKDNIRKRFKV